MTSMINGGPLRLALTVTPSLEALPPGIGGGTYRMQSTVDGALAGQPTAIRSASVAWSRPGILDHLEPYTWTCEVMGRRDLLERQVTYDAEVVLTMAPQRSDTTLLRGWVRDIRRERFGEPADDIWIWYLTLDSPTARAQATRIGAAPWPEESSESRMNRIRALALPTLQPAGSGISSVAGVSVAARDVDSASALEIYQRTAAAQGAFCIEGQADDNRTLVVKHGVLIGARLQRSADRIAWKSVSQAIPTLPARAVQEVPRVMTRAGLLTHAELVTRDREGNDQTEHLTATQASTLPASVWRWETDAVTGQNTKLTAWAQSIIDANNRPSWAYDPGQRLVPSQLPFAAAVQLLYITGRQTAVFRITGGPSDMPDVMAVTGGSLTLGDDQLQAASVTLVPASAGGLGPADFIDFTAGRPWMTQTTPDARWNEFSADITFDQLALVNL